MKSLKSIFVVSFVLLFFIDVPLGKSVFADDGEMASGGVYHEYKVMFSSEDALSVFLSEIPNDKIGHIFNHRGYATAYLTDTQAHSLINTHGLTLHRITPTSSIDDSQTHRNYKRSDPFVPQFNVYHDKTSAKELMERMVLQYSSLAALEVIGHTAKGSEILAMRISDNAGMNEPNEPEVKIVANMHGDETVGRELCLRLIYELLTAYTWSNTSGLPPPPQRDLIVHMVNEMDLTIIPTLNPDGYDSKARQNSKNVDLNRDFPDLIFNDPNAFAGHQLETIAIMNLTKNRHFVLSAGLHGGALVANYPCDGNPQQRAVYTAAADDAVFKALASDYANTHPSMWRSTEFKNGITNGAEWYVVFRGMQDWDYNYHGCMDITLELSNKKAPRSTDLPAYWEDNRESLLRYLSAPLHMGVHGRILDAFTLKPIPSAAVSVKQIPSAPKLVGSTDEVTGDYVRLLAQGEYDIQATAPGYATYYEHISIPQNQQNSIKLDIHLIKSRA